jgi:hypothetical protein
MYGCSNWLLPLWVFLPKLYMHLSPECLTPPPPTTIYPALIRISKLLIMQLSPFLSFYLQIFSTPCSPTPSVYVLSIALWNEVGPYLITAHKLRHYRFSGTPSLLMYFIVGYFRCFAAYIPRAYAGTGIPYHDHT